MTTERSADAENQEAGDTPAPAGGILVPVDFSAYSEAALALACEIAASTDAPLHILHVVHDPGEAPGYYRLDNRDGELLRLQDVAREMFEEFVAHLKSARPDLGRLESAQKLLVVGLPVSRIIETAERVQPALVVMGSAGRTGLSHLMLGSKAEQVVRLCRAPVTIVKISGGDE